LQRKRHTSLKVQKVFVFSTTSTASFQLDPTNARCGEAVGMNERQGRGRLQTSFATKCVRNRN
jgi:hypothetical protein